MAIPPNQIYYAFVIVILCTFATTFIEINRLTEAKLKCILLNFNYWLYFLFQLIGNATATLFAILLLKNRLSDDLDEWQFIVFAFCGVFAFWGVLRHSNINLFNAKVLSFQDWTQKAKDITRVTTTKKDLIYQKQEKFEVATKLKECEESEIDFYLFHKDTISPKEKTQLLKDIAGDVNDKKLYKCMELVSRDINTAKIIIKKHDKELAITKKKILNLGE